MCVLYLFIYLFIFCYRFRATLYQCPETAPERQDMATAVNNRIVDLDTVLNTTQEHSRTQLQEIAQEIDIWQQKVMNGLWINFMADQTKFDP